MRVGELGIESGRACEALGGPLEQALLLERLAKQMVRLSIARRLAAAVLVLTAAAAGAGFVASGGHP
jgi:hypothetical protein